MATRILKRGPLCFGVPRRKKLDSAAKLAKLLPHPDPLPQWGRGRKRVARTFRVSGAVAAIDYFLHQTSKEHDGGGRAVSQARLGRLISSKFQGSRLAPRRKTNDARRARLASLESVGGYGSSLTRASARRFAPTRAITCRACGLFRMLRRWRRNSQNCLSQGRAFAQ